MFTISLVNKRTQGSEILLLGIMTELLEELIKGLDVHDTEIMLFYRKSRTKIENRYIDG